MDRLTKTAVVLILLVAPLFILHTLLLPNKRMAQSPPAVVEFDSLHSKKLRIEDREDAFEDRLDWRGTFTLGEGSDRFDAVNEIVEVTIEGAAGSIVFSQTIPPGSFEQKGFKPGRQRFEFKEKDEDDDDDDDREVWTLR